MILKTHASHAWQHLIGSLGLIHLLWELHLLMYMITPHSLYMLHRRKHSPSAHHACWRTSSIHHHLLHLLHLMHVWRTSSSLHHGIWWSVTASTSTTTSMHLLHHVRYSWTTWTSHHRHWSCLSFLSQSHHELHHATWWECFLWH